MIAAPHLQLSSWVILSLGTLSSITSLCGETVVLSSTADTTLFENAPDNNLGKTLSSVSGTNSNGGRTRTLYRFDVAAAIPAGSTISSASLKVHVVMEGGNPVPDPKFSIHRVQLSWNEGERETGNRGMPAIEGETSWMAREAPGLLWTVPGGGLGTDFAGEASASIALGPSGPFVAETTQELANDVQLWLDQPVDNFGWSLIVSDEGTAGSAHRIATREDPERAPELTIEYEPGANGVLPIEITTFQFKNNLVAATWKGGTPPFRFDFAADLMNWQPLVGGIANRSFVAAQNGPAESYYRVVSSQATALEPMARYRVTWTSTWSAATHPTEFPGGSAHYSGLIGGVHNSDVDFWAPGENASAGIKSMAETGSKSALTSEVNAAITAGTASSLLSGGGISTPDQTTLEFEVSSDHPLVSLVCMIAPSPDWFVGVHGLSLIENGKWLEARTIALDPYDAGTDSGVTYRAANEATSPRAAISKIIDLPFSDTTDVRPLGTFTFVRITE